MTKDRNDNKDSDRGRFYQALVAIKYGMEIPEFNTITIEHLGDITFDDKVQIEVKHHTDKNSLSDGDKEFWNTLYNWMVKPVSYESYILHTTSHFPKTSIFKDWAKLTAQERYARLTSVEFKEKSRNKEKIELKKFNLEILKLKGLKIEIINLLTPHINSYSKKDFIDKLTGLKIDLSHHSFIIEECEAVSAENIESMLFSRYFKAMPKNEMELLLSRLSIKEKQPNDIGLVAELRALQTFKLLKKQQAEDSIKTFGGEISAKVHGDKRWEITYAEFYQILKDRVRLNLESEYKPLFDKYEGKMPETLPAYADKKYTLELQSIKCEPDEINEAHADYWRMNSLLCEANEMNPLFNKEIFSIYKNDRLLPKLKNLKRLNSMDKRDDPALYNYRKSKDLAPDGYKDILPSSYFQHGTMQNIVEDDDIDFNWVIK